MVSKHSFIAKAMEAYHDLLHDWRPALDSKWILLYLSGFTSFDNDRLREFARKMIIVQSAGCTRHYEIPFSEPPYVYHKLVCNEWDEAE